jgi:hypothetical protein
MSYKNCQNCKHSKVVFTTDPLIDQLDSNESLAQYRELVPSMLGRCKAGNSKTYHTWWKANGNKRMSETENVECHEPK